MSLTAFSRPASAASLNDLSPLPPRSNTRPTLALLLTGAELAEAEAAPEVAGAELAFPPELEAAAPEVAAAEVAVAEVAAAEVAAPVVCEAAPGVLLELLPHAATDMAETSPTAARRIAR
jgi:hypothetical protein